VQILGSGAKSHLVDERRVRGEFDEAIELDATHQDERGNG
jgi:hypothetical protein